MKQIRMKKAETLIYAVKHKDKEVIKNSSSGGLFTALSDVFLAEGNAVSSCVYNYENDRVEFVIYDDIATRNAARGSKYIQATIGNGFKDISNWLIKNPEKSLIVFGTGCQMDGLIKYLELKKLRKRVTVVDLICHGVASPGLWDRYLQEKGIKGKLQYLSFKDKRNGWHEPTAYAKVNDIDVSIKEFSEWFYSEWAIRESCYKCPYAKIDRNTDITIGDYWGIERAIPEFASPMGVSLVLIHSTRGVELFEKIKESVDFCRSNRIDCRQPRLISPANKPKDRELFWNDIETKSIEYCLDKYKKREKKKSFLYRIIRKVIRLVFTLKGIIIYRR